MAQEPAQRLVRLGLGEPMQVERGVDGAAPAGELALEPTFDRRERRRRLLRRPALQNLGRGWRRTGRLTRIRVRRRRQRRAASPRNPARDFGPQRDLLVAEAPQAMRALRRLLHGWSPRGRSTTSSPWCLIPPARAPAASPLPKKRSARAGPTIAEPVSWAIISRRNARGVSSAHGNSASIQNGRPEAQIVRSTAIERNGVSATPAPATGPSSGSKSPTSLKNTNDRLRRISLSPLSPSPRSHALRLESDIALSAISPVSIRIRPIEE